MKIEHKVKSLLLIVAALVAIEPLLSTQAVAKSCNAASAQGRGGLNCGPAPVTSNSQATGQVTGTKPSQVGAPTIQTSNQLPKSDLPIDPKPSPIATQPPAPPSRVNNQLPPSIPPPGGVTVVTQSGPAPAVPQQITILPIDPKPSPIATQPPAPPSRVNNQLPPSIPPPGGVTVVTQSGPAPTVSQLLRYDPVVSGTQERPEPITPTNKYKDKSVNAEKTILSINGEGGSASVNEKMIAVMPGRQPPDAYPKFNVGGALPTRACVVSGLERRKTVGLDGVVTYQGALPTFRMVTSELADIPAWHPLDSGCIVSITHKK